MRCEVFSGTDLRRVFDQARAAMGDDVMIVRSSITETATGKHHEIAVARAEDVEALQRLASPPAPRTRSRVGGFGNLGPYVIALVGPTGAGKTTTAAKLATNAIAFGGKTVALLTLDTYRVGAIDQIGQIAEFAGLPLEVAYDAREVPQAMKRLDDYDVVIVDTPGRSPRAKDLNAQWQAVLRMAVPDEVHLVLPATSRADVAAAVRRNYDTCALTHLLLTKADELPDESALAELVGVIDLPTRWLTDGQEIPRDLHEARARVVASLGNPSDLARVRVA